MIYDAEMLEDDDGAASLAAAQKREANREAPAKEAPGDYFQDEPEPETVCRRCKRATDFKGRLCYDCELAMWGSD